MWDFVWHLRGSVGLKGATTNEAALEAVACLLDDQQKTVIEHGPDQLVFDDPLWRISFSPGWLAMVLYDRGTFRIERGVDGRMLRYDLRSLHGAIFCLFAALAVCTLELRSGRGLPGGAAIGGLVFGWLYGMNVLLALARVPRAIRRAVGAAESAPPFG